MRIFHHTTFRLLLCLLGLFPMIAAAQPCFSGYMYDYPGCPGLNTVSAAANTPHITNTYTWPVNITGGTLVSGQGTATAVYDFTTMGHKHISVNIYNSAYGCNYNVIHYFYVNQYSTPNIQGTIPANCTGGQVFTYYATRWQDAANGFMNHMEQHYWTVNGGTTISQNTTVLSGQFPYGWHYVDTIKVAWNGTGPRSLILRRFAADQNGNVPGISNCNAYDTLYPALGPATITGPSSGCMPFTGTYTVNQDTGYTYAWTLTGSGTFLTAQNTPTVQVNWTGPGILTVTKSFLWCPITYTATKSVSAAAPLVPTIMASPMIACPGSPVTLTSNPWASYLWSTGATTQSITVNSPGTYGLTVTDFSGCTGSGSFNLTYASNPMPTLPGNQTLCTGSPIILNPGTFSSYLWSTGATTQTISPTTSGTYSVTVTNATGCTGTASTSLTFLPAPVPNLGPNLTACSGMPTVLNPGTFTSYSWSNGATTPTISPTTSGNYTVTVTDANGCTGTDVVTVTFLTLPGFSLGNDSFVCADTSVLLSGPVGMGSYIWSTGATSNSITVGTGGTYLLTVTDGNGCTASDDIVLTGLTDCVFPGDANYDGVADNQDVLVIGAYYGFAGLARPGATTQWYGQNVANWGGALPGNADPKHSDCNGDGIVQAVDTMAVTANYGQTHTKTTGTQSAGAVLHVIAAQDSMLPGGMATFEVHLGEIQNPVDSVYGIAFTIHYSTGPTANPGLRDIDYSGCWFAGNGSRLDFTRNFYPSGEVDVAAVRQDQVQQAGFGEVCRFSIQTDPNLAVAAEPLRVWLTDVQLVDAQLAQHSVTTVGDSTIVTNNLTGTAGNAAIHPPRIFPNPANDVFQIVQMEAELREATLWDMNGRLILVQDLQDAPTGTISAGALSEGVYFLRISSSVSNYMQKLVIAR